VWQSPGSPFLRLHCAQNLWGVLLRGSHRVIAPRVYSMGTCKCTVMGDSADTAFQYIGYTFAPSSSVFPQLRPTLRHCTKPTAVDGWLMLSRFWAAMGHGSFSRFSLALTRKRAHAFVKAALTAPCAWGVQRHGRPCAIKQTPPKCGIAWDERWFPASSTQPTCEPHMFPRPQALRSPDPVCTLILRILPRVRSALSES